MLDLVVRTDVCAGVCKTGGLISSFKIGWFSSDAMADVLVNAPPVVQLEQLQPPRGVVAGFSSEAELSQQQVELQEQQQQQLLLRQQQGQLQQFWRLLVQTCLQRG